MLAYLTRLVASNAAMAMLLWVSIALILMYEAHAYKYAHTLEPAVALLWIAFVINVVVLWYTSSKDFVHQLGNGISFFGLFSIRKLVVQQDRFPEHKVRFFFFGFVWSLFLIFFSAILATIVFSDIFVYTVDSGSSWGQNSKWNLDYMNCNNESHPMETATNGIEVSEMKSIYSSDYDALCQRTTFNTLASAIVFGTLVWCLLWFLAVYWHIYDSHQKILQYETDDTVWQEYTLVTVSVHNSGTWVSRTIQGQVNHEFYLSVEEGNKLHRYLTEKVFAVKSQIRLECINFFDVKMDTFFYPLIMKYFPPFFFMFCVFVCLFFVILF